MEVGVSESDLDRSAAVERMKAFMDFHIRDHITARDVASVAGYSQFHATRVFKAKMGMTPFEYLRGKRMTAAAHTLRNREYRVLDVALDFVFDSQEGFTRAFTRGFGISPKRFAATSPPNGWLIPFRYLDRMKSKETTMTDTAVIFTQIVERPARKLILKRGKCASDYFEYVQEVGCGDGDYSSPWEILTQIKVAQYEPVGLWLPETMRLDGTGTYAHGVEVPMEFDFANVPVGFDVIDLDPCRLLVLQGETYDDKDYQRAVAEGMGRISSFNPEVYGYEYAPELAPRMQLAPEGWRGYIEMRPVRHLS